MPAEHAVRPVSDDSDRYDAITAAGICRKAHPPYNAAVDNTWPQPATDIDPDTEAGRKSPHTGD